METQKKKFLITKNQLQNILESSDVLEPSDEQKYRFYMHKAGYSDNDKLEKILESVQVLMLKNGKPEDESSWVVVQDFSNENNNAYAFARNWIKKYTLIPRKYKTKPIYKYV